MKRAVCLLLCTAVVWAAIAAVPIEVKDERGKKPAGGVAVEASDPDADDWYRLAVTKSKGDVALVWPFDALARRPNGPEPVPVTVIAKGGPNLLKSNKLTAMLAVPVLLEARTLAEEASLAGVDATALDHAIGALSTSDDDLEKGIALAWTKKWKDAVDPLGAGLRARERVMTRIPSEIYPVALIYGKALFESGKFDDAAVQFAKAVKLRPAALPARQLRAAALEKAGKPEAAADALKIR